MNEDAFSAELIHTLRQARRVAVLTGAGISAESGVPTFRDAQTGLWAQFKPEELATPEAFRRHVSTTASPAAAGEVPLLRLSLKDVRQYLSDRRDVLVSTLAEQHKLEPKEVGRNFDYVVAGLRFFDRLELVQKTSPGQATLTLRLRTSLPLRK